MPNHYSNAGDRRRSDASNQQRSGTHSTGGGNQGANRVPHGQQHRVQNQRGGGHHRARNPNQVHSDRGQGFGREPGTNEQRQGNHRGTPGQSREAESQLSKSTGNPREGSQRGTESRQGYAGRVGGQYGDRHGPNRSDAQRQGFHGEDRYAGRSVSQQDHEFGSRRGHGTRRRHQGRGQ